MWGKIGLGICAIASFLFIEPTNAMSPGEIGVVATKAAMSMKAGRHLELEAGSVVFILDAVDNQYLVITQDTDPSATDTVDKKFLSGWVHEDKVESPQDSIRRWTIEISKDATRISAFINRGKSHSTLRHPDDAISDFSRVLELDSTCIEALLCRAEVYRRTGKFAQAIADTSSVLQFSPTSAAAKLMKAKILADNNRIEEGLDECNGILHSNAASHDVLLFRGYLNLLNGNFKQARADAEAARQAALFLQWIPRKEAEYGILLPNAAEENAAVQSVPWSDFRFWTNLSYVTPSISSQLILFGVLAENSGRSTASLRMLGAALQLRLPPRAELVALYFGASANLSRFEDAEALRKLSSAIQLANSQPQSIPSISSKSVLESAAACCRAGIDRNSENLPKAMAEYDEAIRLNAKNSWAYLGRGATNSLVNELDSAMNDFSTVLEIADSREKCRALALAGRASIRSLRGDNDGALAELSRAIEIKQDLVDLWDYRALAWARRGEFQKALSDSNEALRQQPLYPQCYRARALVMYLMGDFHKCLNFYERALKINLGEQELDSALTLSQRGLIHFQFGQFAESLSDFELAIKRNPKCAIAYAGLATLQSTCSDATYRDGASAIDHATKACELSGWRRGRHIIALAAALGESGEFEKAIIELNKAAEVDPSAGTSQRKRMLSDFNNRKPYRAEVFPTATPAVNWESIPFPAP
jgi:tetratricopeptide (TPR) repeat protein